MMAAVAAPAAPIPNRGAQAPRCLSDGSGYFRARLGGTVTGNIDWRNGGIECEGGPRPDGHGLRVSFAGSMQSAGATHRLRFIFGIAAGGEGRSGRAIPANVTIILEGERRVFSTRGDDKCTVDTLRQEPIARTTREHDYRVTARGFCVEPAASLTGTGRVLVSRFDFAGRVSVYTDADGDARSPERTARRSPSVSRRAVS